MWVLGHGLTGVEHGMRTQQWILAAWEHGSMALELGQDTAVAWGALVMCGNSGADAGLPVALGHGTVWWRARLA